MAFDDEGMLAKELERASFNPSRKRLATSVASTVSALRQPTGRAAPQLVPDGLDAKTHLEVALSLQHPLYKGNRNPSAHQLSFRGSGQVGRKGGELEKVVNNFNHG